MKKKKKGFTLLEMIVAVGLLSIMSVSILKVFLASKDLNEKAQDLHQSVLLTRSIAALIDQGQFPLQQSGKMDPYLQYMREGEGEGEYLLYLDAEFEPAAVRGGDFSEEEAHYLWSMKILEEGSDGEKDEKSDKEKAEALGEGLYRIDVKVFRRKPYSLNRDIGMPIYGVSFLRFFSREGEGR